MVPHAVGLKQKKTRRGKGGAGGTGGQGGPCVGNEKDLSGWGRKGSFQLARGGGQGREHGGTGEFSAQRAPAVNQVAKGPL